jgi:hypothetical protein
MTLWDKCKKVSPGDLRWIEARFPFGQSFEYSEYGNFCFLPVEVLSVTGDKVEYAAVGGSSVLHCHITDLREKKS